MFKLYKVSDSPIYRMRGKGQFEAVIRVPWESVNNISTDDNYHVWTQRKNGRDREIQKPIGSLSVVHGRLGLLLSRIILPDYIYSKKGRSYIDNARYHAGTSKTIKTDISAFYPSITWRMIYGLFLNDFKCAKDVAAKLADICCYRKSHLPTGSTISNRIALLVARKMFDEIYDLSLSEQSIMSVYMDDITISGCNASRSMLWALRKIIHRNGFNAKSRKSKFYSIGSAKSITGVIVKNDDLLLPNKRHKNIYESRKLLSSALLREKKRIERSLNGRLCEAHQILGASIKQ